MGFISENRRPPQRKKTASYQGLSELGAPEFGSAQSSKSGPLLGTRARGLSERSQEGGLIEWLEKARDWFCLAH